MYINILNFMGKQIVYDSTRNEFVVGNKSFISLALAKLYIKLDAGEEVKAVTSIDMETFEIVKVISLGDYADTPNVSIHYALPDGDTGDERSFDIYNLTPGLMDRLTKLDALNNTLKELKHDREALLIEIKAMLKPIDKE